MKLTFKSHQKMLTLKIQRWTMLLEWMGSGKWSKSDLMESSPFDNMELLAGIPQQPVVEGGNEGHGRHVQEQSRQ